MNNSNVLQCNSNRSEIENKKPNRPSTMSYFSLSYGYLENEIGWINYRLTIMTMRANCIEIILGQYGSKAVLKANAPKIVC